MKRTRTYYTIRSIVRWTFWTSVFFGAIMIAGAISTIGQLPECPITLHSDFTYTTNETFDRESCDPGNNVELTGPMTWAWKA